MDSIYEPGSDFDKVRTEDYIYDSEPRRKGGFGMRATDRRKQFHGNGEAAATAKAWGGNTNVVDLALLPLGALNPDMTINNAYSNT